MTAYNYLYSLSKLSNVNVIARNIQYNGKYRKVDEWCEELENKLCRKNYDRIFQFCLPSDFVYTPNSVGITIIEPSKLKDDYWCRKISMMPKVIVGTEKEWAAIENDYNVKIIDFDIDEDIRYNTYDVPKIENLEKNYVFYWIGEDGH
jgi:hypothetical protein